MNREQKAAAIAEIASRIDESDAIFAVDYRGISVAQVAELRARLRDADATFKVVKNSLTERAADDAGAELLKELLAGPTALTFVRGDAAVAAKAVADFARTTQLLPFKGGLMDGAPLDAEQIRSLSRLPSREALYGQLVGVVASPVSGLVRTLAALLGGLAVALGQVREKKESGEIPAGDAPAGEGPAPAADTAAAEESAADSQTAAAAAAEEPAADEDVEAGGESAEEPAATEPAAEEQTVEEQAVEEQAVEEQTAEELAAEAPAAEPEAQEPATEGEAQAEPASEPEQDEKQADASAEEQPGDAEANTTKEE
jgi:large subunit ribosomal protein L10